MTFAQVENSTSDVMRSYGKIYVVMAVCLTILVGLIGYVIATDRKISKLEKEMK
ncbi:MAG: CcmD family protein [Chitinophagaceae bacterium]